MKNKEEKNLKVRVVTLKIPMDVYEKLRLKAISENTFVTSLCYECIERHLFPDLIKFSKVQKKLKKLV